MPNLSSAFEQKIAALGGFGGVDPDTLARLAEVLRGLDDHGLWRINPFTFAEQHGFAPDEVIDLFIVGTKVGLFDFALNILCAGCGLVESSHRSWAGLARDHVHCEVCQVDTPMTLDEQVEVSFTLALGIAKLDVAPFRSAGDYTRWFFSPNFVRSPQLMEIVGRAMRGVVLAGGDGEGTMTLDTRPGMGLRVISLDTHTATELEVTADGPAHVDIEVVPEGLRPTKAMVGPGEVTVRLHNRGSGPAGVIVLENVLDEIVEARARFPATFLPFLSAKALLNHQRFREVFRAQTLDPALRLRIRSLTLLFTDLKGSTELYDGTGDVTAYSVVQEHFAALIGAVRRHRGAVVKTMGDAVMASFSSPDDALRAADEMLAAMGVVNDRVRALGHATGLKIGIHEGPALAVTADDRLDYFGQTVNIAARVQALADAGEIWVTEPVMNAPEVSSLVDERGMAKEPRLVSLKGVGHPTNVFRLQRRQALVSA